jgi:lipoprotein signal peptidase
LVILIWCFTPRSARDGLLCFALGLIFAGAIGNGYDRLVFNGVRDFLRFHPFDPVATWVTGNPFPIFNVADCCLVLGAVVLVFQALFLTPKEEAAPAGVEVTGERLASASAVASPPAKEEPVSDPV